MVWEQWRQPTWRFPPGRKRTHPLPILSSVNARTTAASTAGSMSVGRPATSVPRCGRACPEVSSQDLGRGWARCAAPAETGSWHLHHRSPTWEEHTMTDKKDWTEEFWYRGKVTRRRLIGYTSAAAGALGATMLVPAPWQAAFGQAKPYKVGTLQPLSGAAAAGGKTALVGTQMAVDRINKSGGINGRPIELIVADYESKPDVGRRKAEKLLVEDNIDVHEGGFLSNVCLACEPVFAEAKVVNMIGVCLDTTITTTKCSKYTFRPFDYAPAQAVAFAPQLVKMGKNWHIAYADYAWGQSTRDAYVQQIKKAGGDVVGTTGIPLGTADMTAFLSKISGNFDGLFGIFFGKDGVTIGNQAYDLGLTKKYKWAGDGAIAESTNLPGLGSKIDGFIGIERYVPIFVGPLDTPAHHKFFDDAKARLAKI